MPTWLLVALAAAAILALTFRPWKRSPRAFDDNEDDGHSLKHTIQVNLGLLDHELGELIPIAEQAASSPDVDRARSLLEEAEDISLEVDLVLSIREDAEKDELLERVFGAMNKTTQARRLLGTVKEAVELE